MGPTRCTPRGPARPGRRSPMALLALCSLAGSGAFAAAAPLPHIFLLYVDDWGWANAGFHRDKPSPEVATPAIDAIVAEGIALDRMYAYPYCAPSRAALLSGRLPQHVSSGNIRGATYDANHTEIGGQGVPRNMTTLPQMLAQAGYWSAFAGKWDCGFATQGHIPHGRGYNSSLGYFFQINDYWTQAPTGSEGHGCPQAKVDLWLDDGPASELNATAYEEVLFENHLHAALRTYAADTPGAPRRNGSPLFLHYAPHLVHDPYEVPDDWLAKFDFIKAKGDDIKGLRQVYAAMTHYMDAVVGNLTAHMKSLDLWENTIMIAASDNGANNYPLRSGKFSSFEGGMRVNAFLGGGFIPAAQRGTRTTQLMHVCDIWGTLAEAVGQPLQDPIASSVGLPPLDTVSFWSSVVLGEDLGIAASSGGGGGNGTQPRQGLLVNGVYWDNTGLKLHSGGGNAVWQGEFYPNASTNFTGNADTHSDCPKKTGCLFDVVNDMGEHVDLSASRPADVKRLAALREQAAANTWSGKNNRGESDPRACAAAIAAGGFWAPWVN